MRRLLISLSIISCLTVLFLNHAKTSHAQRVWSAHTEVELISENTSFTPGSSFWVALRMTMEPHWHVYWTNPGDSGTPPNIEWELPPGFRASEIFWPNPQRIDLPPLTSYGYEGEVLLLTRIDSPDNVSFSSNPILKADVKWLACELECVPGQAALAVEIEVSSSLDEKDFRYIQDFARARANLPLDSTSWGVEAFDYEEHLELKLTPSANERRELQAIQFYSEDNKLVEHSAQQELKKSKDAYVLKVQKSVLSKEQKINRLKGTLVNQLGWDVSNRFRKGWTIDIPFQKSKPHSFAQKGSIFTTLLFAFIGGLILNLMPCVLPVLGIKLLGLVEESQSNPKKVIQHSLQFCSGIIVAFWFLAGFLLILKYAGKHVGWGFQFQSPIFLVFMSILFFWLGLSLLGFFEIGTSLQGIENTFKHSLILKNPFLSGVLATIVATPCTAPFMGTAIGVALTQSYVVAFLIFTLLGLGMAFPYLAVSCSPSLIRFIPKPGRWMIYLKRFFGLIFLATVVWLSWVLSLQRGISAVKVLYLGLVIIGVAGWVIGKWAVPQYENSVRWRARIIAIILFVAGFAISYRATFFEPVQKAQGTNPSEAISWIPYSSEVLERLKAEGEVVFIDFTASWCLSCQVNDRVALNNPKVVKLFEDLNVKAIKADWTNYDEQITQALSSYGKASIPVYVLYPKGNKVDPIFLPELLTPNIIIDIFNKNIIE